METDTNYVIFSWRAFNAIVTETIDKHPVETGGILIGYILDNGAWVVVENIPPGYRTIHQRAYFEYDAEFVNYLSNVVALQYKGNLQVLGLWHRHPGSMDVFSSTDDETNLKFARDRRCGSISALVNCDPRMRLTMYHVSQRGQYEEIEWYVDDGETIPDDFLELWYTDPEKLPTFDRHGIIDPDRQPLPPPLPDEARQPQAPAEVAESQVQDRPHSDEKYSFSDAITDIKGVIRKLLNKTDENNHNIPPATPSCNDAVGNHRQ